MSTPRKTAAEPGAGAGSTPSARKTASKTGSTPASRTGKAGAAGKPAAGKAGAAGKPAAGKAGRSVPPRPGPGLVVGTVPALARIAGAVAVLAAVLLLIAAAFPLARAGGVDLGGPGNVWAFVPPLPLAATVAAGGVLALRGRLPRLGLAVLFPAGTVAAGLLLQDAALLRTGSHGTTDLPLGIGTSARYEVGPGLVTAVVAYAVLVAAALLATLAWPRTIMEDTGDLDPRRPRLAAWGLAVGVLTALVLGMAPYSSSIGAGTPTLPERHGLDLLGAAAWAVLAATLRPRLAVVGAYAGLAATLLSIGLAIVLLVARSPALDTSAGGVGVLLAALAAAVLGLVTARVGRPAGKA